MLYRVYSKDVQSLYQELVPFIQTLNMFSGDATSYGLMKKYNAAQVH